MKRLFIVLLTILSFRDAASAVAQQVPISAVSDVFVYPIWGMGGDSFPEVKVELLDAQGKAVATGVSTTELPVVMLKGLRRGPYTLKLTHPDPEMNPVTRTVQLFRPEHWFTESLYSDLQGYVYLPPEEQAVAKNLGTFQGSVTSMPKDGKQPMWARMMGIFSSVIADARVKADGSFEFRIQPGWYVLVIARGTQVCATQQVHSFRKISEGPLRVMLSSQCRQ